MKRSYFLYFGSNHNKDDIRGLLKKYWDIVCIAHDNYYCGEYYLYSGFYADRLTIKDNKIADTDDWLDETYSEYATLIEVSFTHGSNTDRLNRCEFIKEAFSQLNIAVAIGDKCIEEL